MFMFFMPRLQKHNMQYDVIPIPFPSLQDHKVSMETLDILLQTTDAMLPFNFIILYQNLYTKTILCTTWKSLVFKILSICFIHGDPCNLAISSTGNIMFTDWAVFHWIVPLSVSQNSCVCSKVKIFPLKSAVYMCGKCDPLQYKSASMSDYNHKVQWYSSETPGTISSWNTQVQFPNFCETLSSRAEFPQLLCSWVCKKLH